MSIDMTKVCFLDIDGPMIPVRARFLLNQGKRFDVFDPCAVEMLNQLIIDSNAQIVISSTWASHGLENCTKLLQDNGVIGQIHSDWRTPRKMSSTRTMEISWWLQEHPEVTHYVALDDEMLDAQILPRFVQCDPYEGFSYRNYLEARVHLDLATDEHKETLYYLRRREIWRTQRHGDPKESITWKMADELFPLDSTHTGLHWFRSKIE